jgi:two-component sensor histidine kinase
MNAVSDDKTDSMRELLLGMGSSSMRKSYYPELRNKLDDLELFQELVARFSDSIMLFSLPDERLLFANMAARDVFAIGHAESAGSGIRAILSQPTESEYSSCLDTAKKGGVGSLLFVKNRGEDGIDRRYDVRMNKVAAAGKDFMIVAARDDTDRFLMEERINNALVEKETLLKEIHHRVKNNFQLMKSMLALEASVIDDEQARLPLIESENRIMSMAGVHERLYESGDLAKIEMRGYIEDLVSSIQVNFESLFPASDVEVRCAELSLPLDIALPIGLIVNELVSNCVKHAFPGSGTDSGGVVQARIGVEIGRENNAGISIVVSDNGIGIEESRLSGEAETVGLMLIRSLVAQLKGEVSWRNERGTVATARFPPGVG